MTQPARKGRSLPYLGVTWVTVPADAGETRPGLLLRWEHRPAGWAAEVVYLAQLRPGEWATVTEWLASHILTTTPPENTTR